jgi:hypothetical protein
VIRDPAAQFGLGVWSALQNNALQSSVPSLQALSVVTMPPLRLRVPDAHML